VIFIEKEDHLLFLSGLLKSTAKHKASPVVKSP